MEFNYPKGPESGKGKVSGMQRVLVSFHLSSLMLSEGWLSSSLSVNWLFFPTTESYGGASHTKAQQLRF